MNINENEYKSIAHEVDLSLSKIFDEFSKAIKVLGNDEEFIRMRLLINFSFLEVISGIYNSYYDLSLSNKKLLMIWIENYCFTNKNEAFTNHSYLKNMTSKHLYKFRCSIVHAFALPEDESDVSIIICNGNESSESIKGLDLKFKQAGKEITFISPDSLTRLFVNGYMILHDEIFNTSSIVTLEQLNGIKRIRDEFTRRGAEYIPIK